MLTQHGDGMGVRLLGPCHGHVLFLWVLPAEVQLLRAFRWFGAFVTAALGNMCVPPLAWMCADGRGGMARSQVKEQHPHLWAPRPCAPGAIGVVRFAVLATVWYHAEFQFTGYCYVA